MVDTGTMSIRRPAKPRLVTVHNGTGRALVFNEAGRVIPGGARIEGVDANDPTTAALIRDRDLHVIEENK